MCGIFGIIVKEKAAVNEKFISNCLETIARYSIARGQDSSGIVFKDNKTKEFNLVKGDVPINRLLKSHIYKNYLKNAVASYNSGSTFQAIGHARLVTNGSQLKEENNQPVIKDGIIGIHNGIIVNADKLWDLNPELNCEFEIDTEIFLSLVRDNLNRKLDLNQSACIALNSIEGSASLALFFEDRHDFVLATNTGSLYYIATEEYLIFASEEFFLESLIKKIGIEGAGIIHLKAFTGLILNIQDFKLTHFEQKDPLQQPYNSVDHDYYKVNKHNLKSNFDKEVVIDPSLFINRANEKHLFNLLEYNEDAIKKLKRCTKCILPETFPFIQFDNNGVCNYCKNYKLKNQPKPIEELYSIVKPYRRNDGRPDCIVPFSGGRDSTYALHIVKKELGLNPIAFTYDWGMVTDLSRRNIARVCGKLGVENIIVSADISWKRVNIRKNVEAWLANPSLGMIPIFMAGDKYFYYYANKVKERNGILLNLFGMNDLENTDFKIGFAGVSPNFDKERIYSLSKSQQFKLFKYVSGQYIQSPKYFNQSILDTAGSFFARYFTSKTDYYHLFDYVQWDEKTVEDILFNEYNWEKAIDTDTTWRIGDGTASFYNYIYYTVSGFSEYDTFRSNQIREGMIDREQALALVNKENFPRYETIRWYLEIIGLDFETVIKKINTIPKLYEK